MKGVLYDKKHGSPGQSNKNITRFNGLGTLSCKDTGWHDSGHSRYFCGYFSMVNATEG